MGIDTAIINTTKQVILNVTNHIVHPSISNDTINVSVQTSDHWSAVTAIATVSLVIVLIWQTALTRQQIRFSHLPFLTPRFVSEQGNIRLLIVNVGNGNAVDVHLKIHDINQNLLVSIDRYALVSGEAAHTGIDLEKYGKIKITGTFLDTNKKKHKVDTDYEYPPKYVE